MRFLDIAARSLCCSALLGLLLVSGWPGSLARAAEQAAAAADVEPPPTGGEIRIRSGLAPSATITDRAIMQLLDAEITFALGTKQSTKSRTYRGPLLWTLLLRYAAIDPTKPKPEVRQVIWVTGNDSYTAAIAMGEVSPNFEGKRSSSLMRSMATACRQERFGWW